MTVQESRSIPARSLVLISRVDEADLPVYYAHVIIFERNISGILFVYFLSSLPKKKMFSIRYVS